MCSLSAGVLVTAGAMLTVIQATDTTQFSSTSNVLWTAGAHTFRGGLYTEADMNGDGVKDIVSIDDASSSLVWVPVSVLGTGNSQFIASAGSSTLSFAVADMNGDGFVDVLAGTDTGQVTWYQSVSSGSSFTPHSILSTGATADDIAIADLNNDGRLDFVVLSNPGSATGEVKFCLQSSTGTYTCTTQSTTAIAKHVAIGDVTNTGKRDVIVYSESGTGGFVQGLLGNGDGTFQTPVTVYNAGGVLQRLKVGDLDGDGKLDIVYSKLTGGGTGYLQQPSNYASIWPDNVVLSSAQKVYDFALQDMDGSTSTLELLAGSNTGMENHNWWYLTRSSGTFTESTLATDPAAAGEDCTLLAMLDINGDGYNDAIGQFGTRGFYWLNNGAPTPAPSPAPTTATPIPTQAPTAVCPVCVNGGTCTSPATLCSCPVGWSGSTCSTSSPATFKCATGYIMKSVSINALDGWYFISSFQCVQPGTINTSTVTVNAGKSGTLTTIQGPLIGYNSGKFPATPTAASGLQMYNNDGTIQSTVYGTSVNTITTSKCTTLGQVMVGFSGVQTAASGTMIGYKIKPSCAAIAVVTKQCTSGYIIESISLFSDTALNQISSFLCKRYSDGKTKTVNVNIGPETGSPATFVGPFIGFSSGFAQFPNAIDAASGFILNKSDGTFSPTFGSAYIGSSSKLCAAGMALTGMKIGYDSSGTLVGGKPVAVCSTPIPSS